MKEIILTNEEIEYLKSTLIFTKNRYSEMLQYMEGNEEYKYPKAAGTADAALNLITSNLEYILKQKGVLTDECE